MSVDEGTIGLVGFRYGENENPNEKEKRHASEPVGQNRKNVERDDKLWM